MLFKIRRDGVLARRDLGQQLHTSALAVDAKAGRRDASEDYTAAPDHGEALVRPGRSAEVQIQPYGRKVTPPRNNSFPGYRMRDECRASYRVLGEITKSSSSILGLQLGKAVLFKTNEQKVVGYCLVPNWCDLENRSAHRAPRVARYPAPLPSSSIAHCLH